MSDFTVKVDPSLHFINKAINNTMEAIVLLLYAEECIIKSKVADADKMVSRLHNHGASLLGLCGDLDSESSANKNLMKEKSNE